MNKTALLAAAAFAAALPSGAAAVTGQSVTPAGYAYVGSCSGTGFGGFAQSGNGVGVTNAQQTCADQTSASIGSTAVTSTAKSGSVGGYAYTTNAVASATLGKIHLFADSLGSGATQFSGSQAVAGWNDSITIAGAAGQQAIWVIAVHVEGTLSSTNLVADSQFGIEALLNHQLLQPYGTPIRAAAYGIFTAANAPLVTGDVFYSWDYQMRPWRATDYGTNKLITVDQFVTFAIPFTYNVPFTLGIFAQASAGESSSGPFYAASHSTVDFGNTIAWGGKGYLLPASGTGPGSTAFAVQSSSGYDYNVSAVSEPASWTLMLAGFGVVGAAARRRPAAA